jgi:hypothetical protein
VGTDAQNEANRRNAQQSTGPRTEAGKKRASLNARTHGLTAADAVIPGESEEDFEAYRAALWAEWEPKDADQAFEAELAINDGWRLFRAQRLETGLFASNACSNATRIYHPIRDTSDDLTTKRTQSRPTRNNLAQTRRRAMVAARAFGGLGPGRQLVGAESTSSARSPWHEPADPGRDEVQHQTGDERRLGASPFLRFKDHPERKHGHHSRPEIELAGAGDHVTEHIPAAIAFFGATDVRIRPVPDTAVVRATLAAG